MFFPHVYRTHKVMSSIEKTTKWAQLLTEYGGFAASLYNFKLKDVCVCSLNDETVEHLLFEYLRHVRNRGDLEFAIGKKLAESNLGELIANKDTRPLLARFCVKVVNVVSKGIRAGDGLYTL